MKEERKKALKIAIIGADGHGKTTLTEAIKVQKILSEKDCPILIVAEDNNGTNISMMEQMNTKTEVLKISNTRLEDPIMFTPPPTRRERRKAERKKNKNK